MKKIIYSLLLTLAVVFMASCSDFFDKDPINKIAAPEYFDSETALRIYANGMIIKNLPNPGVLTRGDQYSDISITATTERYLQPGYLAEEANNWKISDWSALHDINYFLVNMWDAEPFVRNQATMMHYEGVGRLWRAWFYWNKVKTFGDVPWYDAPIDADDEEELYKGRDTRDFVMAKVLEDINFAVEHCSKESKFLNKNVINGYVALALKSRIALFEGTYRKYHNMTDSQLWLDESLLASEEMMTNSPYSLYGSAGNEQSNYSKLFKSLSPVYSEVILSNEMSEEETRTHDASWYFASASAGQRNSATKAFVNMYLKLDGTRFTDTPNYNTVDFKDEFTDRDYRLQQTIITPGYEKIVSGVTTTDFSKVFPDRGSQLSFYRIMKWNMDDTQYENTTSSLNSICAFRYAEILLNYAEAKAELGAMGTQEWNKSIRLLRQRSGVDGVEPLTFDPYLVEYYVGVTDKWILEARRERSIEMYMENVRIDDLMRWKMGHRLANEFSGIHIPALAVPFDIDGDGKNDLCFFSTSTPRPSTTQSGVTYIQITENPSDAATTFGINADNCLVYRLDRVWKEHMYLKPIPQTAINVNSNLEQNEGWEK